MSRRIEVGAVTRPHGIKGGVHVRMHSGDAQLLRKLKTVWLQGDGEPGRYKVARASVSEGGHAMLEIEGVGSRDDAEALRGCRVLVDEDQLPPLEDGEFYYYQMVGLRVFSSSGREAGTITDVFDNGAQDVMVVKADGGRTFTVPIVDDLVSDIDFDTRRVVLNDIDGLVPGAP